MTNGADNRIATFASTASLNGEQKLTFDGTTLNVSGTMKMSGSILPGEHNVHDLGGPSNHWANIYTGDLHLKNDRGDYTIIEEEDYLSLRNNKTGKMYKFVLQEIE